jgi:hypothetical protein
VQVVGLRALNRDVTRLAGKNGPLAKALAAAGTQAVEPIAAATRSALPQVSGRLAGDVRVSGLPAGAAVQMGRSSLRYAGWVEFGGRRRAPHESVRSFGYQPRGTYLFPAAVQLEAVAARRYAQATNLAVNAYPWTNETSQPGGVHD